MSVSLEVYWGQKSPFSFLIEYLKRWTGTVSYLKDEKSHAIQKVQDGLIIHSAFRQPRHNML